MTDRNHPKMASNDLHRSSEVVTDHCRSGTFAILGMAQTSKTTLAGCTVQLFNFKVASYATRHLNDSEVSLYFCRGDVQRNTTDVA